MGGVQEPAGRTELSAANIRYLIAMRRNQRPDGIIRGADVARALSRTRPSVHKMVESLSALGLVSKSCPYGAIRFTPAGEAAAAECAARYAAAEEKLRRAFPALGDCEELVCSLLAALPGQTL